MSRAFLVALLAVAFLYAFAPRSMAQFSGGPSLPGMSESKATPWKHHDIQGLRKKSGSVGGDTDMRKKGGKSGPAAKSKHDTAMPAIQNTR
jgi:hypothetical protein